MNEAILLWVAGMSTIAFPILLFAGFALHPKLFSPRLTKNADDLIVKFRGKPFFHLGHLLVFFAVPLIVMSFMYTQTALQDSGKAYGAIGAVIGIIGAIVLMIGMINAGLVPRAGGIAAIIGLALLNNPDIDLISSVGALLMCTAYVPFGLKILAGIL